MGKDGFLTPKAIANRIKVVGPSQTHIQVFTPSFRRKGCKSYDGIARCAKSNVAMKMDSRLVL